MNKKVRRMMSLLCVVVSLSNAGMAAVEDPTAPAPQEEVAVREDSFKAAVRRVIAPSAAKVTRNAFPTTRQSNPSRNWIQRHPVWLGTIIGAGAGAVYASTTNTELFCNGGDEDCLIYGKRRALYGAGLGAGIGAGVSAVGRLFRK